MNAVISRREFVSKVALSGAGALAWSWAVKAARAANSPFPGKFQPDWRSLQHYKPPQWFRDAKFGIFLHWGVYSVPAYSSEWYPRLMYLRDSPVFEWHRQHWGPQSTFGYKDFIPLFRAQHWNPDGLVDLFRKAGARYIVPVGEHCDGFPMYDSHLTRWCAARMGPHRDVVAEWARAIRNQGLKLGVSTHRNWHWSWYTYDKDFDTVNSRYSGLYGRPHAPGKAIDNLPHEVLQVAPLAFLQDWYARTVEILNLYQPDLLWLEWGIQSPEFNPYKKELAAYFYNFMGAMDKEAVITYKGDAFPAGSAVFDVERGSLGNIRELPWQSETSISWKSWGYIENDRFKSATEILQTLADVVSKNGNLLLNVGPKPDGTLPEEATETFRQIAGWMSVNAEAIFGTQPWKIFGEGAVAPKTGSFGESQRIVYTSGDVRFTKKRNTLYAILMGWPDREARIQSLGAGSSAEPVEIEHLSLLGSNEALTWKQERDALIIQTPVRQPCPSPCILRIALKS